MYVSQAINDAVADVRMDCVPTLPVTGKKSLKIRANKFERVDFESTEIFAATERQRIYEGDLRVLISFEKSG